MLWLLSASRRGYPVSTTHSIVSSIVGASVALCFIQSDAETALALVQWSEIGRIARPGSYRLCLVDWSPTLCSILSRSTYSATTITPISGWRKLGSSAGLWFIGKEVIQTVGYKLTKMHQASGFSAELSAAAVVMMSSILGIPLSSTYILIGAVLGVGLVDGHANWGLMKPIGLAWMITLPAATALGAIFFIAMFYIF